MSAALQLSGVTKTYKSGVSALKGIDLTVAPGDFFALLGPNGAGKSTSIGIVSSLVKKTAGQVSIFGYDLDRDTEEAKRQLATSALPVTRIAFDVGFETNLRGIESFDAMSDYGEGIWK